MKKISLLHLIIVCLIGETAAFASSQKINLINPNKYDISVTYHICSTDNQYHESCEQDVTVLIKAKKIPDDKNYLTLTQETPIAPNIMSITIYPVSAIEKDENGNIIAQAFFLKDKARPFCTENLYYHDDSSSYDSIINFDDMNQSPFIGCFVSGIYIN